MKSKTKVKGKKCYYYSKLCHLAKGCYKKQNDLKGKKLSEGSAVMSYDKKQIDNGLVLVNVERNLIQVALSTCAIKGAKFVPELERNLASLEMLDGMEFDIKLG